MSNALQQGIADIVLPVPPANMSGLVFLSLAVILVLAVLLLLGWRWFHSARARSLRALRQASVTCIQTGNYPDAVYSIAAIIRGRLGTHYLSAATPVADSLKQHEARWQQFIRELQELRYASSTPRRETVEHLVSEAEFWIKTWP